jgi:hypothetical protein
MAIIIFTVLNGLGVTFMLYVLLQFWKEGRRAKNTVRPRYGIDRSYTDRPEVFIVTHPISQCAQGGLSLIPMTDRERSPRDQQIYRDCAEGTMEISLTRRAGETGAARFRKAS